MTDVLSTPNLPTGLPYAIGGTPSHTASPTFNRHRAGIVPPAQYIAQNPGKQPHPVNHSPADSGLTGLQQPLRENVSKANPVPSQGYVAQSQPGSQPHATQNSPADSEQTGNQAPFDIDNKASNATPEISTSGLKKSEKPEQDKKLEEMSETELAQEGQKRLESAKKAYTKHGQFNIAEQSQKVLQLFIGKCTNFNGKVSELVSALKGISLPAGTPTDLSVTIKYPGEPSFSLIPLDEKHLGAANIEDITKWYQLADMAMGDWSKTNMADTETLASAKRDLDNTLAALKAVSEALDKRYKEKTGQPGDSRLEIMYQQHVDRGVTIHFEAKDANLLEYSAGKKPQGPIANPEAGNIGKNTPPLPADLANPHKPDATADNDSPEAENPNLPPATPPAKGFSGNDS